MARMPKTKRKTYSIGDTDLQTWFERDRAHVELRDRETERTLLEFWDEDVGQLIEDGFLDRRDLHGSMYKYAVYLGVIKAPTSTSTPSRHHATRPTKPTKPKKKSPAQLDREIAESLSHAPTKVAGFTRPAGRQPGYQIVSVPILKGPRSIGPSGLDLPRERNESVVFSTRAEAEAYLPSVQRFAADFGRDAVIKEIW